MIPRSSSSRAAFSIDSMSLLEPITMPTRGASTSMSSSCACTSDSSIGVGTSEMPGVPLGLPSWPEGSSVCSEAKMAGTLQRRDEVIDRDRRQRLVAGGAARAELERDARHRAVVGGLHDRDEVDVAERRPLRLDGRAELLHLLV